MNINEYEHRFKMLKKLVARKAPKKRIERAMRACEAVAPSPQIEEGVRD